jgi:glutamyl-tRNA reductase
MTAHSLALACVGLSHHTSPLEVREAIALSNAEVAGAVQRLRDARAEEVLVLSTCNRTEFYTRGLAGDPAGLVRDVLLSLKGFDIARTDGMLIVRHDPDSVRHLFRVACGLDSMVLGEPQILGQVREAAQIASDAGGAGLVMGKMVEIALAVAKKARHETAIGEGPISFPSAGVELARKVFGSLEGRHALVIGAGEIARLVVEHLHSAGAALAVANRTEARGRTLAAVAGGPYIGLAGIPERLAWADLVVTATSSSKPLVDKAAVREAMRHRGARPLVFLDLSVPRNVDPEVNATTNVFVHDVDALRTIVEANLEKRRREIPRVEAMIDEGIDRFLRWHRALAVVPTIAEFREHVERIRAAELERFRSRLRESDRPLVEALTHGIVQKILHEPTSRLRESAEGGLGPGRVEAVRYLFGLDERGEQDRHGEPPEPRASSGENGERGGDATRDSG